MWLYSIDSIFPLRNLLTLSMLITASIQLSEYYKEGSLPTLENFLKMRQLDDSEAIAAFEFMADKFLHHVAGKKTWKKQRARLPVSAGMSISDRAFLYLVLVNYWDNWEDQVNGKDTMISDRQSTLRDALPM